MIYITEKEDRGMCGSDAFFFVEKFLSVFLAP